MIATIQLLDGSVMKTRGYGKTTYIGDPINTVKIFSDKGIDELVVIDISTRRGKPVITPAQTEDIATEAFISLAYGGSIKTYSQARDTLSVGVEKVIFGSGLLNAQDTVATTTQNYGRQVVVGVIDVGINDQQWFRLSPGGGGRPPDLEPAEWARQACELGAGELIVADMTREGEMGDYNLDLMRYVADAVPVPVIAHGGASRVEHFAAALDAGAAAVVAGSMFTFYGPHRVVLITYPTEQGLDAALSQINDWQELRMIVLERSHYIMCSVDDPAPELADGVCSHCRRYEELPPSWVFTGTNGEAKLPATVEEIREAGAKKRCGCLIGPSGGVDPTPVAIKVKELGLRPPVFHVDNGWNTKLAVSNVEKTVKAFDLDLVTEVLDPRQLYDLQYAFLLASTPDADVSTDHAIQARIWKSARKYDVKYIISGMDFRTEAIGALSWSYGHSDWRYIKVVHDKSRYEKFTTCPYFGFTELGYTNTVVRVWIVNVLNYFEYNKAAAVKRMQEQLNWRPYPSKHLESIFTRFFQGYIPPVKFNIDKRRGHLPDLINSGQITREQAPEEIEHNDYTEDLIRRDREFFCKKLSFTDREFDDLMVAPVKSSRDYKNFYGFA